MITNNLKPKFSMGPLSTKRTLDIKPHMPDKIDPTPFQRDFQGQMKAQGFDYMGAASGIIGGVTSMMSAMPFGRSEAVTDGDVLRTSVTDLGQGVSSGVMAGSSFGPLGSVIGGVAGGALGAIGKKGGITETGGFTEDNTYNKSTGIRSFMGGSRNSKLKKKFEQDRNFVLGNRIAVQNESQLMGDYYANDASDAFSFAYGGQVPMTDGHFDDGELLMTPDGEMGKIPEQGQPTDSNYMQVPSGTQVLSDKLKVPGKNMTFAEYGEKILKYKKSKGSDKFAENTNKLNQQNAEKKWNELFQMQEEMKMKKDNKSNKYAWGGIAKGIMGMAEVAPIISNLFPQKEQQVRDIQNPYAGQINKIMANRHYDINPALKGLADANATANYNINQYATNTGANMASRLQLASNYGNQIVGVHDQRNKINNQYKQEYANTLNDLGQQYARTAAATRDINMRTSANRRNIKRQGYTDLSTYAQNMMNFKDAQLRDDMMMPLLMQKIGETFGQDSLAKIQEILKKGGRKTYGFESVR